MTDLFTVPSDLETNLSGSARPEEVNGRFRIKQPDGSLKLYSRVTTYIGSLGDRTRLDQWRHRVGLIGLQRSLVTGGSLWADLKHVDPDDKDALNEIWERAFTLGDGHLKAERGTNRHTTAEQFDMGQDLDPVPDEEAMADLAAYVDICSKLELEILFAEQRVVIDWLKVTGTPDRVVRYKCLDGKVRNVIADLKTGSTVEIEPGKVAQQMALYSRGELYDHETGERTPLPDVSQDIGLLIHAPQGEARAVAYEVNLNMGWAGVQVSRQVREYRNWSKKVLHPVVTT